MYQILLDSPDAPAKRIQIARLGPVKDKRYGDFAITADNVANWQKNLSHLPGQRALIDYEHRSEKRPRNSEAAGWITGIHLDGNKVMADAEWTDTGAAAIKSKRYLFLSPAYGKHVDEHGKEYDDTLCSVALTNKPVLSLPALTLASEERLHEAFEDDPASRFYARALDGALGDVARALVTLDIPQAERDQAVKDNEAFPDGSYPIRDAHELHSAAVLAASGHGDAAAAKRLIRRRAKDLGVSLNHLPGMSEDVNVSRSDAAAREAVGRKMDAPLDPKALVRTLSLDEDTEAKLLEVVATLEKRAAAGWEAQKELLETTFATAFDKALKERKVTPAERELLLEAYEKTRSLPEADGGAPADPS